MYDQLNLPFGKQLALFACALGPAGAGKLDSHEVINNAVDRALQLLETPMR